MNLSLSESKKVRSSLQNYFINFLCRYIVLKSKSIYINIYLINWKPILAYCETWSRIIFRPTKLRYSHDFGLIAWKFFLIMFMELSEFLTNEVKQVKWRNRFPLFVDNYRNRNPTKNVLSAVDQYPRLIS